MHRSFRVLTILALGAVVVAAGCSKPVRIKQYPAFWTPELQTLAVVPFRTACQDQNAGTVVSENFTRALQGNGTYRVMSHGDLGALMDQKDLDIFARGADAAAAAAKFRPLGKVQGLMVGTVTLYNCTSNTQQRSDPQYVYDNQGRAIPAGNRVYSYTRNEATVAVSAAMIRVKDGTQIHATGEAQGHYYSQGEVPSADQYECLRRATQQAVAQLVDEFAVTDKLVKIGPKNFQVASEYYDGKYTYTNRFGAGDKKMLVVLQLPQACDRNHFRIAIVRENDRKDLAETAVTWDRQWSGRGQAFEFDPSEIAKSGGGPGIYLVKLYAGPDPIVIQKIKIQ